MITMMQKYDTIAHDWSDCQYFKVDGVEFPSCVMIDDDFYNEKTRKTTEYVLNLKGRKDAAHAEVVTLMGDCPEEIFINEWDTSEMEYEIFKKYLLKEKCDFVFEKLQLI